jgi:hypothetical protein
MGESMNINIHKVESVELSELKTLHTENGRVFSQRYIVIKTKDSQVEIVLFAENDDKLEVKA